MRCEESLESPILKRVPAGTVTEVLALGRGFTDRRVCVREADGSKGWVSLVAQDLTPLWREAPRLEFRGASSSSPSPEPLQAPKEAAGGIRKEANHAVESLELLEVPEGAAGAPHVEARHATEEGPLSEPDTARVQFEEATLPTPLLGTLAPPQEDAGCSRPEASPLAHPGADKAPDGERGPGELQGGACRPGSWLESVSTSVLRAEESLESELLERMPAYSIVQLLGVGSDPEGRRVRVRTSSSLEGWVSLVSQNRTPLWRPLQCEASVVMGGCIEVRPYTPADRQRIFEIERGSFAECEHSLEMWLGRSALPGSRCFVDVAVAGGSMVVGYIAWVQQELDGGEERPHFLNILSLAVAPSHRGLRVGEQLLRWAQEKGVLRFPACLFAVLHVRTDNLSAQRLYKRNGYWPMTVMRQYYGDCDALEMLRELPALQGRVTDPAIVLQMASMGFPREDVESLLRLCQGNPARAVALLLGDLPYFFPEAPRSQTTAGESKAWAHLLQQEIQQVQGLEVHMPGTRWVPAAEHARARRPAPSAAPPAASPARLPPPMVLAAQRYAAQQNAALKGGGR